MSDFYAQAAAGALESLKEAGRALPIARIKKSFDPVAGASSAYVATKGEIIAVNIPINKRDAAGMDSKLLEALTAGRLVKLIVAAAGALFEPAPLDIVTMDGSYLTVRGCTPLKPAATPIIYTIFAERGNISAADIAALNQ